MVAENGGEVFGFVALSVHLSLLLGHGSFLLLIGFFILLVDFPTAGHAVFHVDIDSDDLLNFFAGTFKFIFGSGEE